MRSHLSLEKDSEANAAASAAARGAVFGATKWGIATAALGVVAYAASPLYRGLTVQFKVYAFPPFSLPSPAPECNLHDGVSIHPTRPIEAVRESLFEGG